LPFLVPPETIDSESLILSLAYGDPSLLEACCVLGGHAKRVSKECEDIAVADLNDRSSKWFKELAGVRKIALPIPPPDSHDFAEAITFPEKNFNFSLSLYCSKADEDEYDALCEDLLLAVRRAGLRKANLLRSRTGYELHSENVVSRSAMDFVAFPLGDTLQWGLTVYVPEAEGFRARATEKPYVSSGISLSPRLARLLVNVSGVPKGGTILDPFCGSGTILGEALLRGINCIGIDRNHGRVEQTKKNLSWLLSGRAGGPSYSVLAGDATNPKRTLGDRTVDAVVSEPILLPRISSPLTHEKARRMVSRASETYSEAIYSMSHVLRPGGRIAIVAPSVQTLDGREVSVTIENLEEAGLRFFDPPGYHFEYPLRVEHQSTRWIRRMLYVLERA
jgi:tRNA G10  N-methylase Trm11